MKQRFSSLDVKVITRELAADLTNLRVSNIYDLSSRIFLFKLAKPDHKRQIILDSGFRIHSTAYARSTATTPSGFTSRLRKTLKTRRITSITQIGTDRIIDLAFSDGQFHLFLEFFAGGNIILTDRELGILAVFRVVTASEGEEVKVGGRYVLENKQNYAGIPPITAERVRECIERARRDADAQAEAGKEDGGAKKSKKKKGVDVLRRALSQGFPEYPPLLLEHAFSVKGFDSTIALETVLESEELLAQVEGVLEEAERVTTALSEDHPGYIIAKKDPRQANGDILLYEDFHPFKPHQFTKNPDVTILEYPHFNTTVDEYFSSIESQKLESRLTEREETAKRKLDSVRLDHEKKIGALQDVQDLHIRKAGVIEDNVYRVQEAMDAVNGLVAQGMDWVEIARLIEMEQGRGNPVARIIKLPLKLYENTITLALGEASEEADADAEDLFESESESESTEETEPKESILTVDIDLGLSPWANATQYYDQKKVAALKEQKTAQSSSKALKSHEKKVTHDLQRGLKHEKQVLRPTRQPFWFEKFLFFISSEGYLVLGGRDSMQSEMLYRRHLKKGDIFIYADLKGATPLIVKNRQSNPTAPIPPSTLSQAGNMCVATSSSWESKAIMSAYWVHARQVSKTTTGGLLPTGEFSVNGEKNFLAPSQLVLGFAVMWQVSKESLRNHKTGRFESEVEAEREPEEEQGAGVQAADVNGDGSEDEPVSEQEERAETADTAQELETQAEVEPRAENGETESKAEDGETESKTEAQEADDQAEEQEEEGEAPAEDDEAKDQPLQKPSAPSTKQKHAEPAKPPKPASRTKKAKSKKAAAKYADQDEEERELALRLIGGKSTKAQKASAAAEAKAKREQDLAMAKERRKAQHERAAEAERKRQAAFAASAEAGEADDYDEETAAAEAADLSWIPALVGTPHVEDEILAAIPICAPWAALGKYKYRVKLQPGTVKKGKAVKEMHGRWVAEMTSGKVKKEHAEEMGLDRGTAEDLRAREGELVKGWKDTEIVNTLPVGRVRIMSGGGDAKGKSGGGGGGGKAKGGGGGAKGKGKKK